MKKRLISLVCALVLLVSALPTASALEGEAQRSADTLATLGLMYSSSDYGLDQTATRAQAVVLLVRLAVRYVRSGSLTPVGWESLVLWGMIIWLLIWGIIRNL